MILSNPVGWVRDGDTDNNIKDRMNEGIEEGTNFLHDLDGLCLDICSHGIFRVDDINFHII